VKIVVTFSGLDPNRLAEHVDRHLRERRATRATVARPRPADDIEPLSSQLPRPSRRRSRRDRRS
jgi:hypothetical protein